MSNWGQVPPCTAACSNFYSPVCSVLLNEDVLKCRTLTTYLAAAIQQGINKFLGQMMLS